MAEAQSTATLIARLKGVLLRQRLVLFAAGLLTTFAVVAAVWIGLSLVASVTVLSVWFKLTLLLVTAAGTVYVFARFAVSRLFHGNTDAVALALEQKNPELKGRLIAAVQFARARDLGRYSSELVAVTQQQALQQAENVNFGEVITFHPILKTGRFFLGSAVLAALMLIAAPGVFRYAFEVYSHPTERVAPPVPYRLVAVPLSTEWIKYRDIRIGGALIGERLPDQVYIHHRPAGGDWQKTKVDRAAMKSMTVLDGDSLDFGITLRQVNRSFDFYVEAGELTTEVQQVDVVDRPRVTGIKLSVFYPSYTGLPPMSLDEMNGSFSAVVGSRVNLQIAVNQAIEQADLVFEDSSRLPLKVAAKTAEGALVVEQSKAYRIHLLDHLGETNPDPVEYYITAVPDEYPSIDVVRPGFDVNMGEEMVLPLLARIFDDYGFSSLVMKYTVFSQGRASDENVAVLHFSDKIKTEGDIEFNWDMNQLDLLPGDWVTYYFEVADNDRISGPKVTASRKYLARIPSLDEIVAQAEKESIERITKTEDLIQTGKELSRRLKEAARKLEAQSKESQNSDWQQQKEMQSIGEQSEEMLQQVEQTASQMEKSLERMQESSTMSREIMEKLAEIQKLFQEVATPEMWEAQKRMMEALKNMDPMELQKAMENMQLSQQELMERLERTLALLKQMQVRQKMEAMLRKAEELVKRQNQTNKDTEAATPERLPELSKAEDQTRQSLEDLKQELQSLRDLMKEAKLDEDPEAQRFADAIEKSDAGTDMQEMSKSLQNQQQTSATKEGKSAHSKLLQMLDQMQQAQQALNSDNNARVMKEMRRALDHATTLSQDEEQLINDAQVVDPTSVVLRDMAARQQEMAGACNGLKEWISRLGKESPFIAAELQQLVDNAARNMEAASQGFDTKQGAQAVLQQQEAMVNLNRAATRLMESMEQQGQCNNPKPDMQQMESMCKRQSNLNRETQNQCNNPGQCNNPKPGQSGKPSESQGMLPGRESLGRLAAEQGAIRKSVQQLEQEFGGSRQVLGRLSDIANEMKQVEEAMLNGEIGPETLERQLNIYSRMLEASRSLQRKDFSEQRKATSATGQETFVPPSLSRDLLDDRIQLEDRLRRFMGDDYPPQYEEQIKAYFKALLKAQSEQTGQPSGN